LCNLEIRKEEIHLLEKSLRIQSMLGAQPTLIPVISAVVTFFAMTMTNQNISVTQVGYMQYISQV